MDIRSPVFNFAALRNRLSSPALIAIADHWQEVRGTAAMPSWSQIRPSAIAPYLTCIWAFKFDRKADAFTARLAGNRITAGFGKSFRGTLLDELHSPEILEKVRTVLRRLVLEPCIYHSSGPLFRVGDYVGEGERIVLPLAADGLHGDGVLGASKYGPVPAGIAGPPVELLLNNEEWFSLA
jgi:hypothetical protein